MKLSMMKISIVIFIILLFNCDPNSSDPNVIDNNSDSYFPMSTGKSIVYEYNYDHLPSSLKEIDNVTFQYFNDNKTLATTEIIDERMFRSVEFEIIENDKIQYNGGRTHAYVPPSTESAGVGILDYIDSPGIVIYDSVSIGDTWEENDNISTASSIEDVFINNFNYKDCIKVETEYNNGDHRTTYFAKGIGIVKLIYTENGTGYIKTFNYIETINAQSGTISGTVTLDGNPLQGLKISITEDDNCSVISDSNGEFSLSVYGGGLFLYFFKDNNGDEVINSGDIVFGRDFIDPSEHFTLSFNTDDADYYYPDDFID